MRFMVRVLEGDARAKSANRGDVNVGIAWWVDDVLQFRLDVDHRCELEPVVQIQHPFVLVKPYKFELLQWNFPVAGDMIQLQPSGLGGLIGRRVLDMYGIDRSRKPECQGRCEYFWGWWFRCWTSICCLSQLVFWSIKIVFLINSTLKSWVCQPVNETLS